MFLLQFARARALCISSVSPSSPSLFSQFQPSWLGRLIALAMVAILLLAQGQPAMAALTPTDPLYPQQWGTAKIEASTSWEATTGSSSVIIAIVDTGIDASHPEFAGRVLAGKNTMDGSSNVADNHGRGTHLAGIAAGTGNNGTGIAGIDWQAKILPVKAAGSTGYGTYASLAAGIRYAADRGAKVILTGITTGGSDAIYSAVQYALSKDVVIIAAAGDLARSTPMCPACYPGVIVVAATDQVDGLGGTTNYGSSIGITAPGVDILSTVPTGSCSLCQSTGYRKMTGSTAAAAHVAGGAGLVIAENPGWSGVQVKERLLQTTDPVNPAHKFMFPNAGRLNVAKAVGTVPAPILTIPSAPTGLVAGTVTSSSIGVGWTDTSSNESAFQLFYRPSSSTTWSSISYGAGTTSATVSGLTAGTSYVFMVRACNSAGCSSWSSSITVSTSTTFTVPSAPIGLIAGTVSKSSIGVKWTDTSSNESKFQVSFRLSSSTTWTTYSYISNTTSATIYSLPAGTSYVFQVRACNSAGCSSWSNAVTASTTPY